jgi:hypothetical protein
MSVANLKVLVNITITHGRNDTQWVLVNNDYSSGYFEQISFDEGLEQNVPSGTLLLRDPGDILKNFNFSGRDGLSVTINDTNPLDPDTFTTRTFFFIIYQVNHATDYADRNQPRMVTLKFIDQLYFYNERRPFIYEEDFKLVSSKENYDEESSGEKGWANEAIKKFSSIGSQIDGSPSILPYYIDASKNYAWLKEKQQIYPSGRKVEFENVLTLLNYLSSNAVDSTNSPNFFCWKDLHSFNFISYSTMVGLQPSLSLKTGLIDAISNDGFIKINSISAMPNLSFMELENNGAFSSYYERVDPDFSNPYFTHSDVSKGYTKYAVTYGLGLNFKKGGRLFGIAAADLGIRGSVDPTSTDITKNIETDIILNVAGITSISIAPKRFYDDGQWGYFDESYFNDSLLEPSYSIYTEQGITMKYQSTNRVASTLWQNMFDIEELNPVVGVTLQIESEITETNPKGNSYQANLNFVKQFIQIRKDINEARNEYYTLRELKERWNVFKYVVCCMANGHEAFYAVILGATAADGSDQILIDPEPTKSKAFKYAWKEVEFMPKEYEGISGSEPVFVYPEFGVSGGVYGCTCGEPENLPNGTSVTGITFSNSHPFFNIFIPNGARSGGYAGINAGFTAFYPAGSTFVKVAVDPYFPAFNVNELTNYELSETGLRRKYVGPGINMDSQTFPEGNKLIPIGYMPSYDDPCKHQYHGQVVRMYQIPLKTLKGLSLSQADMNATPVMYVFDAQNAIEGQCEECLEG